jgi:hypothetical protein
MLSAFACVVLSPSWYVRSIWDERIAIVLEATARSSAISDATAWRFRMGRRVLLGVELVEHVETFSSEARFCQWERTLR